MIKSIYKIENLVNHKIYIGQTNNLKRRFQEHRRLQDSGRFRDGKLLYRAIKKYGLENFAFEEIEQTEDYDSREKYWIKYYDSYNNGYNLTEGGDSPPTMRGEEHPGATHTKEDVQKVIDLLRETSLSTKEISSITKYNTSSIVRINTGELWYNKALDYPIRKEMTYVWGRERALKIIKDLKETNLSQKEIAKKYGVSRTTVTAINRGQNHKFDNLTYPIRE